MKKNKFKNIFWFGENFFFSTMSFVGASIALFPFKTWGCALMGVFLFVFGGLYLASEIYQYKQRNPEVFLKNKELDLFVQIKDAIYNKNFHINKNDNYLGNSDIVVDLPGFLVAFSSKNNIFSMTTFNKISKKQEENKSLNNIKSQLVLNIIDPLLKEDLKNRKINNTTEPTPIFFKDIENQLNFEETPRNNIKTRLANN